MAAKNPKKKAVSQKKSVKNGKAQPKKKVLVAVSKAEFRRLKIQAPERDVIMSETEGYVTDEEFDDGSLENEFSDDEIDAIYDNLDANDYK